MKTPTQSEAEQERLDALRRYEVLDTPPEEAFDDLTTLAAHICEAPIALISLIDEDRQWFKSRYGFDVEETARSISFCGHAIEQSGLMIVPDAAKDSRFAGNPLVTAEPKIRFYAGAPLVTPKGQALGTLCVIDRVPRKLKPEHERALRVLSRHVMTQLELRRRSRELERARKNLEFEQIAHREIQMILERVSDAFVALDRDWNYTYVNPQAAALYGRKSEDLIGRHIWTEFPEGIDKPFHHACVQAFETQKPVIFENYYDPWKRWFENRIYPSTNGISVYFHEITRRKRTELLLDGSNKMLEMIASGLPVPRILEALVRWIESLAPGMVGSVLLLDEDGVHMRHGAAPSLPAEYVRAIDGSPIGPEAGPHGAAAHRKEPVFVGDIATDPLWEKYKAAALPHGLRACWSTPILAADGTVLGTFAMYYGEPCLPNDDQRELIDKATHLASVCISRDREHANVVSSERRLRLALDAAKMGIFDWDIPANKLTWSRRHEEIWGFGPGEFGGTYEAFVSRIHPSDYPLVSTEVEWCREKRRHFEGEFRVVWPDGSVHWVHGRGEFEFDEDGKAVRMRGAAIEITKRKKAEIAARKSEARYRSTLDSIMEGCQLIDFEWRYLYLNGAAEVHNRRPNSELMGRRMTDVWPGIEKTPVFALLEKSMKQRTRVHEEVEFEFPDGDRAWFDVRSQPVPEGIFVLSIDVTEGKRATADLEAAHARLKALSSRLIEVQEFERRQVARELHDAVGQALTALKINVESIIRFADEKTLPSQLDGCISLIERALDETRALSLNLRPPLLDDLGLIPALNWLAEQQTKRTGVAVSFRGAPPENRLDAAQETACFRIVQEAVTNALRHSGARSIDVSVRHDPSSVAIRVRDDGSGFDPVEARSRALHGRSMGMLGMEERAALVGGSIHWNTAPGTGTEIEFTLPRRRASAPPAP